MPLDYTAYHRDWLCSARLASVTYNLTQPPSRRLGFDSDRSTAEVFLEVVPGFSGLEENGFVNAGWNGIFTRFFTGQIQQPRADEPGMRRSVRLIDALGKLIQNSFTEDIVWSGTSFTDAVEDILTAVGVDPTDIVLVEDPGLLLGDEYDITIKASESPAQVWRQLMEYGGTKALVFPNGKIYVLNVSGIPTESYAVTPSGTTMIYAFNATENELPIIGSSWVLETLENPVISVTVSGPARADGVTPTGNATITGSGKTVSMPVMRFVQSASDAEDIATRELSRQAVPRKTISFQADANLDLYPGQTIGFRDEKTGIDTTIPAFVWAVDVQGVTMTVTVLVGAHIIEGYSLLQDPVSVPTIVTIEKEPVLVTGVSTVRYFVQYDGTGSFDPDGSITGYDWTFTGGSPSPSTSTDPRPIVVYNSLAGTETAALTVTDNHDNDDTATITLPASDSGEVVSRQLLIAEGAAGLAFLNDGETWQVFTRPGEDCTAVPPMNQTGSLISGWSDGGIYKFSAGYAGLEELITLDGSIGCMFVNEGDSAQRVIGHGNKLSLSHDAGDVSVWEEDVAEFDDPVLDCQSSRGYPNEIRVLTGRYEKISFDRGANWTDAVTGAVGTTARMMATAPWGHAVVFSGGADETDAIDFEESHSVDWTLVVSPPASLYSITPLLDREGFTAIGAGGDTYSLLWDGSQFVASLIGTMNEVGTDLIRDGLLAGLQFACSDDAADGKTVKLLNLDTFYDVRDVPAKQIGYGEIGTRPPPVTATVLRITRGVTGAERGVQLYDPVTDTWTAKNSGLPTIAVYWEMVVVCPTNSNMWALLGNSAPESGYFTGSGLLRMEDNTTNALWVTDDRGATWTSLGVGNISGTGGRAIPVGSMEWVGTTLFIAVHNNDGGQDGAFLWSGTPPSDLTVQVSNYHPGDDSGWADFQRLTAGLAGDIVLGEWDSPGSGTAGRIARVQSGGGAFVQVGADYFNDSLALDKLPGLSRVVYVLLFTAQEIWKVLDYRSGVIESTGLEAAGTWLSASDGLLYIGGRDASGAGTGGIYIVYLGTSTSEIIAGDNVSVGCVRVARQQRLAVAAVISETVDHYVAADGLNFSVVTGPALLDTELADWIEVIDG